jgi:hypothetical protein
MPEAGSVAMLYKLPAMADEFMETVRQFKQQTARSNDGNADPMHLPAAKPRKRSLNNLNLTPPRKAREVVQATQDDDDDMESDSLSSHTSHTRRKRLLAPWKLILVELNSKCSIQEVMDEFAEFAVGDLLKAGVSDDIRRSEDAIGGFKPAQVLFLTLRILHILRI